MNPIPNAYWILPGKFMVGPYPGDPIPDKARQKLRWLLNQGISFFLDLTEEDERDLIPYVPKLEQEAVSLGWKVEYLRTSIRDYDTPSQKEMVQILNSLDAALSAGHRVYLHCFGGVGRTGTVVGCYLVRHGRTGIEALDWIAHLRRYNPNRSKISPETEAQRMMVLNWEG